MHPIFVFEKLLAAFCFWFCFGSSSFSLFVSCLFSFHFWDSFR